MNRMFRGLALALAVVAGGLLTATPIRAEKAPTHGVMKVDDKAGLFSSEGVTKAKEAFEGTSFKSSTHLLVVTTDSIPSAKKAEWDEIAKKKDNAARSRFGEEWARALGRTKDAHGDIVVLVYKSGDTFFVSAISDKQSDVYRHFSDAKARDLDDVFLRELRKVKTDKLEGDAAKHEMDKALISATEKVIGEMKETSAPDSTRKSSNNHVAADNGGGGVGRGIGGWICMIGCILLGVWLVTALIRAFTGGGGGYGGGYGGGPGYGGGGGFFSSLLGGMFGAAAGMWMYNNFFGGHSYNDAMAGDNYGNETGDTGDGNYDDGAAATDGDWGDDGGSGGGDWGGDAGGGGDWGGGGGDFGGGGDW